MHSLCVLLRTAHYSLGLRMILKRGNVSAMADTNQYPMPIRIAAKVFSYIFHPLFLPLYIAVFFIYELKLFPERTEWEKKLIIIQFFIYYTFLPLITTVFSKSLGFIESVHLKTQKDRIIPYVICQVFYFWGWYVFKNIPFPDEVIMFGLGVFLSGTLGLMLNAYMKVSMHGLAVGAVAAFMLLSAMDTDRSYGIYIALAFLVAGITCTARLIDSDHSEKEIYTGFFAGAFAMLVASFFV